MGRSGVISMGEALIDFIPTDEFNLVYQKSPGGAPANVAVGVARLGGRSTFLGKVGQDSLGAFLTLTLKEYGVRIDLIQSTLRAKTGFTLVTNHPDGERSFEFFINPSADRYLENKEIDVEDFTSHKLLHFGSISMIDQPAKKATYYAVELAEKYKMIISYDPNLRTVLWESDETARETILSMFRKVDILKLSDEELKFVTSEEKINKGIEKLQDYNIPIIFITCGSEGVYACKENMCKFIPAMKVQAVDTTGAGDGFMAGVLYLINKTYENVNEISIEDIVQIAKFATVSGGLVTSKKGAMTALPTLEEVEKFVEKL
ncbi:carbohydrate kinase family protein [Virgibacillus sp. W0181]|uniref:carbohydrate kinase family protein n=1 Tax=Virgibacillus sp. W0181 TaxID=3391581 RepID=UPI003F45EE5B